MRGRSGLATCDRGQASSGLLAACRCDALRCNASHDFGGRHQAAPPLHVHGPAPRLHASESAGNETRWPRQNNGTLAPRNGTLWPPSNGTSWGETGWLHSGPAKGHGEAEGHGKKWHATRSHGDLLWLLPAADLSILYLVMVSAAFMLFTLQFTLQRRDGARTRRPAEPPTGRRRCLAALRAAADFGTIFCCLPCAISQLARQEGLVSRAYKPCSADGGGTGVLKVSVTDESARAPSYGRA